MNNRERVPSITEQRIIIGLKIVTFPVWGPFWTIGLLFEKILSLFGYSLNYDRDQRR